MKDENFEVIMTRTNESNIADSDKQNSIREICIINLSLLIFVVPKNYKLENIFFCINSKNS